MYMYEQKIKGIAKPLYVNLIEHNRAETSMTGMITHRGQRREVTHALPYVPTIPWEIVKKQKAKASPINRLAPHAIGDAAVCLFQTPQFSHMRTVAWGECDLLDAIAREAGMPDLHVLTRHKRILDALERDPRFKKFLFRCHRGSNRKGNARAFKLIQQ